MPFKDPKRKREYEREYQRQWIAKKRERYMKGKVCAICGTDKSLIISTSHHSNQDFNQGNLAHGGAIWSASPQRRRRLLKGSRVLCRSCFQRNKWEIRRSRAKDVIKDIEEIFK